MSEQVSERLAMLGGAGRRRDVVRRRGDALALQRLLEKGDVRRAGCGVYALQGCTAVVVTAVVHQAAIGCVSAVERAGLAVLTRPPIPHLVVPRDRGRVPSGLRDAHPAVVHRESGPAGHLATGVDVVELDRALARMLVCCPATAALVSIDDALHRRLATTESIARHLPGTAAAEARRILHRADGRSRSPLETLVRLALRAEGMRVDVGRVIPMVGEVDLVVDGRVVVELDGFAFHSGRREFREDRRRDRELALQGYVVLRFTAEDVLHGLERVVAVVRASLDARRRP